MRLLSGRARETEIKLSEGFQSGPGADSDFWTSLGSREAARTRLGWGSERPHAHLLCRLPNAATARAKQSIHARQDIGQEDKRPRDRGTEGKGGKGQRTAGIRRNLQALRVIRATCTAAPVSLPPLPTVPTRPVACDVDNTKLLVK